MCHARKKRSEAASEGREVPRIVAPARIHLAKPSGSLFKQSLKSRRASGSRKSLLWPVLWPASTSSTMACLPCLRDCSSEHDSLSTDESEEQWIVMASITVGSNSCQDSCMSTKLSTQPRLDFSRTA